MGADGRAADLPPRADAAPSVGAPVVPAFSAPAGAPLRQSIHFFGGRMSVHSIGDTAIFNALEVSPKWDNSIAGFAYQHDIWRKGPLIFGVEVGVADRFGPYHVCCDNPIKGKTLHSGELWGGLAVRHHGTVLFDTVRIGAGLVAGASAVTKSIGREREREIGLSGNASVLVYLAPELYVSLPNVPNLELVLRVHHRSGIGRRIGNIDEGYNANALGIRYWF